MFRGAGWVPFTTIDRAFDRVKTFLHNAFTGLRLRFELASGGIEVNCSGGRIGRLLHKAFGLFGNCCPPAVRLGRMLWAAVWGCALLAVVTTTVTTTTVTSNLLSVTRNPIPAIPIDDTFRPPISFGCM